MPLNAKEEKTFRSDVSEMLEITYGVSLKDATASQLNKAISSVIMLKLAKKATGFKKEAQSQNRKRVYYLSLEFLLGRMLRNNLYNLGMEKEAEELIRECGFTPDEVYREETDPGLGNGGLGRLAACYMDGLTSCNYIATGYSIRYEYGIFRQKIVNGWQLELPDLWLEDGSVWLAPREDETIRVRFGGQISERFTSSGLVVNHYGYEEVLAVPYDMFISGHGTEAVNVLRLWTARAEDEIDMALFARGEYAKALEHKSNVEAISKVLYPADDHVEGKILRIRQQYLLVSATLQQILRDHYLAYGAFDNLPDVAAIHINDTHPAMCIPEMLRLLMDEYGLGWDEAFSVTSRTLAYTNHTVMSEALERWPVEIFKTQLPRIYGIICEINRRLLLDLEEKGVNDPGKVEYMSICSRYEVRMANLCLASVHMVNGVSELHSRILREQVFRDYYSYRPEIFTNVTNGIAHRRWLCEANPDLTALLKDLIGDGFVHDAEALSELRRFENDKSVLDELLRIKRNNKARLAEHLRRTSGVILDENMLFDVQVKRLHEYKRQLLNALHILSLYAYLKENPGAPFEPRTFLFGAKASAAYHTAKRIIKLICAISDMIAADPDIRDKLKVVFVENYSVSAAEVIIPAADVSEQISVAGKEASGTGNMKLMINGALTVGTLDGANIEIMERAGRDNIFIFGLTAEQVNALWAAGYNPISYYSASPYLKKAVDMLNSGIAGEHFADIAGSLIYGGNGVADPYMCLADFDLYHACQEKVSETWKDREKWARMSLHNIAGAGFFAADRAVKEYADRIWNVKPVLLP
ncbi:MAG: glycogen/starch/alpha-glucan phosphorylase [Clostridia bacterium]|nr:glycogen/starch/alpha-glucan phosphorylase [Clostridia bacterium]